MDVPGLSLFQGAESIKLNNDQQRAEEEDAIEDRLRRNEELKNELQNAFDDLAEDFDDDDDVSVSYNTSNRKIVDALPNVLMFNGINSNNKENLNINNANNDLMKEILQLKNVMASKNQELKNLTSEFATERMNLQHKIDELTKRLTITEGEKERANMGKQQLHELLIESKEQMSNRDEKIAELSAKTKSLEAHNLELLGELERTKSLLNDVQHRYHMIEKNVMYSTERNADNVLKQMNDRHAAQTDMMQQQINTMRTKLEDKENELKRLMIQNSELHRSRESMLLDKSDTINQLTKRLDESQRQCQELIMKSSSSDDLAQENVRLMRTVTALEQQNDEMQRTIRSLTMRMESTSTELEQLTETAINDIDAVRSDNNLPTIGITDTPLIRKAVSQPKLAASSTPLLVEDRLTRLKQEFNRCVADQRAKRMEIHALRDELSAKNKQIDRLKADENHALIELTMSKENAERLAIRLKNMERELEECKKNASVCENQGTIPTTTSSSNETVELENRLRKLEQENENFRMSCNHLNETIRALEDERDGIEHKYREACKDIAELQQRFSKQEAGPCLECEKEKFLTKDAQQECTRLKELYIKMSEEKEEIVRKLRHLEAHDLNKELLEQRNMVASLERSLQLADMKCTEMTKILEREKVDHESQIQKLRAKYEEEISSIESKEQKDLSNSCRKCIDLATKVAKYEIENLQLQTACSGYLKDIHELKKSMKKSDQTIADLSEKLAFKEEHDKLLDNLKSKAKEFEEFMQNQSPTKSILVDVVNSRRTNRVRDQCVSTDDLLAGAQTPRTNSSCSFGGFDRSAEKKRIREEMARGFAARVSAIESGYQQQIRERETDITNLKKCILKERFEVKNIMEQKELEYAEAMKKQQSILMATRHDLELANKRIETLLNEMKQCGKEFQAERESTEKRMKEWQAQVIALTKREQMLIEQIQMMESSHKATVQNLNEKYTAAKKTAINYRKYAEDKEKHIQRESERIKLAYETVVENLKEEMRTTIKEQENDASKRIAEMQSQLSMRK